MEFRPLHRDFGVEVLGFDLQHGGTRDEIAVLREAYDRHHLLLFRKGGRVSADRHVEIAGWFGPPAPIANDADGSLVTVLQNEEAAGRLELPFHSDLTYTADPIDAICLHAIAVPEGGSSTTFVSSAAAWDKLPAALQAELADKTLRHFYNSRLMVADWPSFAAEHPVRLAHPRTGRPILFVTENHAERILEMDAARSRAVIEELFGVLYAPEARYQHWWELDDLVMWDNLAIQHARTEEAHPRSGKRALQRVALARVGFHELLERARAAEAV
ncbi:TauD/TfdA dioxygenase family protein [Novosphingobium sp. JCM 18896]|uniref:TauD/TfdA dioxygenase family protein n=1 Tax=Novosphingobium sp. JCM 18896 TaxID=2989731 RepID=UPI002221500F|nr:TauD/TfdA family dioxygenase [Novosphingobium sp. JCM 18896]MCW1427618.1 TauD/TfdA family dioxygenase [Novosphingobium sp. JCM 18896]